jgi:glutamyl-tRNA reductase
MSEAILFVVGATHRTAPLEFRERISVGVEAEARLAAQLSRMPGLREFTAICTCNRVEIYGVASDECVPGQVADAFCALQRVNGADFGRLGFITLGSEAVRHLFEVAAGLDSQILGETEILGQVKRAYSTAQSRGSAGAVLNRLFQKSFQAAKQARTQTGISTGQVSLANLAVDVASDIFGRLENARVMVIGAGEMGEKSAKAFASRGAGALSVSSRHQENASDLAGPLQAVTFPFEERESRLADWDVVVSSTAASGTVISAAAVRAAMARRPGRPMLFLDLAMPRDVEAEAANVGNVYLYNLDDLARIAEKNRLARSAEAERAREMLAGRSAALWRQVAPHLAHPEGVPAGEGVTPAEGRGIPGAVYA